MGGDAPKKARYGLIMLKVRLNSNQSVSFEARKVILRLSSHWPCVTDYIWLVPHAGTKAYDIITHICVAPLPTFVCSVNPIISATIITTVFISCYGFRLVPPQCAVSFHYVIDTCLKNIQFEIEGCCARM